MSTDLAFKNDGREKVGVFVDFKNMLGVDLDDIGRFASRFGRITVKRVYMPGYDWKLAKQVRILGYQPVLVAGTRKESAVDAEMMTDMMIEALQDHVSIIIVASGDADFLAAIRKLREIGKYVAVYSEAESLSRSLLSSADHVEIRGAESRSQASGGRHHSGAGSEINFG